MLELDSFSCFLISIPPYHLKRKITNRTDYYHTLFIRRSVSLAEMCPLSDGQILDWFSTDGHGGTLAGRAQMARPSYVYGTIFYITIVSDHADVTIYLIV